MKVGHAEEGAGQISVSPWEGGGQPCGEKSAKGQPRNLLGTKKNNCGIGGSSSGHAEPQQTPVSPEACSDRGDSEHVLDQTLKLPRSFCRAREQAMGSSRGMKEEKHLLGGCCSF